MRIRELSLSDLEAMAELDLLCFSPETAFDQWTFRACLRSRDCYSFGIDIGDKLAAFGVLYSAEDDLVQIFTLDVHPGHRRQGLADKLMAHLIEIAHEIGAARVALQVAVGNEPAIALYHKWGFSILGLLPDYYGPGRDGYFMDRVMAARGQNQG